MKKIKRYAFFLASLMLLSLAGCGKQAPSLTVTNHQSSVGISTDVTSDTESGDDITAETMPAVKTETENEESASESIPAEKTVPESSPQGAVVTPPPAQSEQPRETQPPRRAEIPKPEEPKPDPSQPVQPQTPAPQEPALTEPEPSAKPPQESAEIKPEFNINDWIDYAKNYAVSVGLRLESSAVDCWDNPITAGAHSSCLQRDIESRLNRYSCDEDITDIWIWAEKSSDGSYDLYIGYA